MSSNLELSPLEGTPTEKAILSTLPTELRQRIFHFALELDQGRRSYQILPRKPRGMPDNGKSDGLVPIYTSQRWIYLKPMKVETEHDSEETSDDDSEEDFEERRKLPNFFNLLLTDRRTNMDTNYLMVQKTSFWVEVGKSNYPPASMIPPEMLPHITSLGLTIGSDLSVKANYVRALNHLQGLVEALRKGHSIRKLEVVMGASVIVYLDARDRGSEYVAERYQYVLEPLVGLQGTGVKEIKLCARIAGTWYEVKHHKLRGGMSEGFKRSLEQCVTNGTEKPPKIEYELQPTVVKKRKRAEQTVVRRKGKGCFDPVYRWNIV